MKSKGFTREEAEKILVSSGLAPTAPDEVIRSALFRANWHADDVETAILVLRENVHTHKKHLEATRTIFRRDVRLSPKAINDLLGISVGVTSADVVLNGNRKKNKMAFGQFFEIAIVAFLFSSALIFGGMWFFKVGMFHQTVI